MTLHVHGDRPRRLRGMTRQEYERIGELGIFDEQRVELLYGFIVEMGPIGPEHADSVDRASERLQALLSGRVRVRTQGPFAASDTSEPHPMWPFCHRAITAAGIRGWRGS